MIDFRSDTVTLPTTEMRKVMFAAELGDDVFSDDPSVNRLEHFAAERHGFDKALFVSSGTQANLLAIMSHCSRGEEYLCGQQAHNYKYEAGGAAVLGSVQPQPIENNPDGTLCLNKLAQAIKPEDFHFAKTKMLSLENTIAGKVLPLSYLTEARAFCDKYSLQLHLDGARVYNAAVATGVDVAEISKPFDSMTVCLSKGLGAPVGSILLGEAEFIARAKRLRKMLGGGMRQAGFLAAAGQYALEHHVKRLAEDHENAQYLAEQLNQIDGFDTSAYQIDTNIVFLDVCSDIDIKALARDLYTKQINILPGYQGMRLVTHLNISRTDIQTLIEAIQSSL